MVERAALVPNKAVGWQSGLMRRTRNAVGEKSPRRFKSSTHRLARDPRFRNHFYVNKIGKMQYARKGIVSSNLTSSAIG